MIARPSLAAGPVLLFALVVTGCSVGEDPDEGGRRDAGTDAAPDTKTDGAPDAASDTGVDTGTDVGGGCAFTGTLAAYDLSTLAGTETSAPAATSAPKVTAGDLARTASLTPVVGAGSLNSSGWLAAFDKDTAYTVTLGAPAGCRVVLESVDLTTKSSGTGPTSVGITTSVDSFVSTTPVAANSTVTATVAAKSGPGGSLEIRIHGWGGPAVTGTMRIGATLTVKGRLE